MKPWSIEPAGAFASLTVDSRALVGNALGDPTSRPLEVYLPPGYDDEPERRYPSVYVIQGLTGQVDMWRNRPAFRLTFPEMVDELFASGTVPPCIVVFVDAWTSIGGSQFLDSPGTGRYHTYLCEEVVPLVDARFRTLADAAHRGITGHSSGGYGAMVSAMLRPDLWGGIATHAGDALFEVCYQPDFRECARALSREYGGDYGRFWEDFRSRPPFTKPNDANLLNQWCMAACYSADEDGTVHLPFDVATGRIVPGVWERWLAWDPVRMAPRHADALRGLRAIWVDAGKGDDWYLDLGAEAFRAALADAGASEVHFELFDGKHSGITFRYPLSLAYLAEHLS
jgi:hypothetical protein